MCHYKSKLHGFMILIALTLPLRAEELSPVQTPPEPSPPDNPHGPDHVSSEAAHSCPDGNLNPVYFPNTAAIKKAVKESLVLNFKPRIVIAIFPDGRVLYTRFSNERGSGNTTVDEQIMIWAKQVRFQKDTCKIGRIRLVIQPIDLDV